MASVIPRGARLDPVRISRVTGPSSSRRPEARATTDRAPEANGAVPVRGASVGGKAVAGPLQTVRLPGRDVDVLLPATPGLGAGDAFAKYVDGLSKSGAFPQQAEQLAELGAMKGSAGGGVDARPTVGI